MQEKKAELYDAVFESSDLLVAGLDTDGRVVIWNPACEKVTGYRRDEVIGRHFTEFLLAEGAEEKTLQLFDIFREGIVPGPVEVPLSTKTGEERVVIWSTNIITDDEGKPDIGLGMGLDITRQRRKEEELIQRSSELESIFQALPDLFFRVRPDGTIVDYRASQPSQLYASPQVFLGRRVVEVLPPDAAESIMRAIDEVVRTGSLTLAEYSLPLPDGEQVFEARMLPLYGNQVMAVIRNITERKETEKAIRAQRDLALKLSGTHDPQEAVRAAFNVILEAAGMDCGAAYFKDKAAGGFRLSYIQGISKKFAEEVGYLDAGSAYAGIIENGLPVYQRVDKLEPPLRDAMLSEKVRSVAVAPIRYEGGVMGCMVVASRSLEEVPRKSREIIEVLAGQVGQAVFRTRLMSALEESEVEKKTILESVSELVNYQDAELRVLWANRAACDSVGLAPEQLVGRHCYEVWGRRDYPCEGCPVVIALETGRAEESEMTTPDGRIWFIRGYPVKDEGGEVAGVVEVTLDITERKRAEYALRESEERYHTTFESTGTAMFLLDRRAYITEVNRVIEEMFGYTREEVVGKKRYMDFVAEEDLPMVKRKAVQLLAGEIQGPIQYECRALHKSGRVLHVIVNVNMLPGIDKSVVSVMDISDEKAYERELKERAEELRSFMDIAAHELRHPATLLKGYAMTLQERGREEEEAVWRESLWAVERGADRLVSVVEELLDVSRIERDRYRLVREEADIGSIIDRAVREMEVRGSEHRILVRTEDGLGRAEVDAEKLVRLLVVLLENAARYSPAGSEIEVAGERKEGELVISVMDHGVGIPDEDRERIFERFFQVEDTLHHGGPGLGLGLYIGKRIAEGHGGRLWCEPRQGGGSIFRFSIPTGM